jgi:hypothetical protein
MQLSSFPEPTVISSSGKPDYVGRYEYTGTRDYTGFSALPSALGFIDYLGGHDKIYGYNRALAVEAGRMLSAAWGTQLLVSSNLATSTLELNRSGTVGSRVNDSIYDQCYPPHVRCQRGSVYAG